MLITLVASAFVILVLVVVLIAEAHGVKTGDPSKPPDTRIGEIPANREPFCVAAVSKLVGDGEVRGPDRECADIV